MAQNKKATYRDVTIDQILHSKNAHGIFYIDDVICDKIAIVAKIVQVEVLHTNVRCLVNDEMKFSVVDVSTVLEKNTNFLTSSNEIFAVMYRDGDQPAPSIQENQYYRISGTLKIVDNKVTFLAFQMNPAQEIAEEEHHRLSALSQHLQFTRPSTSNTTTTNNASQELDQKIVTFIEQNQDNNMSGTHISAIMNHLPGIEQSKIRSILEKLNNQGVIYSTIDNDHFQYTDTR